MNNDHDEIRRYLAKQPPSGKKMVFNPKTGKFEVADDTVLGQPQPITINRPKLVQVAEAPARRRERLDDEIRSFNNLQSASTAIETVRVSYASRVSTMVDLKKSRILSGNAGVKFYDLANAQVSLRNELVHHYSLRLDGELTYEQSTVINIPAHTNVEVIFHWNRIWATGMLTIADQARRAIGIAEVPFEITIALTFDKETRDIV